MTLNRPKTSFISYTQGTKLSFLRQKIKAGRRSSLRNLSLSLSLSLSLHSLGENLHNSVSALSLP